MKKSIEVLTNYQDHITPGAKGDVIISVELAQALKDAAEAMQKQIPSLVYSKTTARDVRIGSVVFQKGTTIYKCHKCGRMILPSSIYCPDCGQKLDWGLKRWT